MSAWLLLQIADVVFPAIGLTGSAMTMLVVLLAIGFPVALILGWRYDLGPEGLVRTRPAVATGTTALHSGDYLLLGALLAAVGLAAVGMYNRIGADGASPPIPSARGEAPTIAVLPLVNMSDDPENDYFADGLTEELLNVLAQLDGLKVIGRTSSFAYKDKQDDLREIGEALDANYLVEGSVRQSGDRIRVTAQLINAADGSHLWSDTFDRDTGEIFAIQSSIAAAVVNKLQVPLLSASQLRTHQSRSFNAYDRYLAGNSNLRNRDLDSLRRSIALFKEAIAIDSEFAPAYAALAIAYIQMHVNHAEMELDVAFGQARAAIESALALDPESSDAFFAMAMLNHWSWQIGGRDPLDRDAADQAYRQALAISPNNADATKQYANFLVNTGRIHAAIEYANRALELDPLAPNSHRFAGALYEGVANFDEARRLYLLETEMHPAKPVGYLSLASLAIRADGDLASGMEWGRRAAEVHFTSAANSLARIWLDLEDYDKAREIYEQIRSASMEARWVEQLYLGNYQAALEIRRAGLAQHLTPPSTDYRYVGRLATFAGDFGLARDMLGKADPRLLESPPFITARNLPEVTCLAIAYQHLGEPDRATQLIDSALDVIAGAERMGTQGYGFSDARLLALRGETDAALNAFEAAIDSGVRSTWFADRWPQPGRDPAFASLHDDERFIALLHALDRDRAEQRLQVIGATE
ncbi:MAG: hypothetical protein QNJ23_06680 [Woeseiaceae bacterium]|nr:hypothetical protein [Woeseiaceae bacterium]